jgi:hypothetical protein
VCCEPGQRGRWRVLPGVFKAIGMADTVDGFGELGEKGRRRRAKSDKIGGLWRGAAGDGGKPLSSGRGRQWIWAFGWAPLPPSDS